jgi:hypothetical protein
LYRYKEYEVRERNKFWKKSNIIIFL